MNCNFKLVVCNSSQLAGFGKNKGTLDLTYKSNLMMRICTSMMPKKESYCGKVNISNYLRVKVGSTQRKVQTKSGPPICCIDTASMAEWAQNEPSLHKNKHFLLHLQCISRIWTSLTWLKFVMVVWFWACANFHFYPRCLKNWWSLQNWSKSTRKNHLSLLV